MAKTPSEDEVFFLRVAPKGFEAMTTFDVVFGDKHRYHIRLAA